MPVRPVILNNTPLVALWLIDRLELLRDLYGEILIPQAVFEEFNAGNYTTRQATLLKAPWIQVAQITHPKQLLVYTGLDKGEAEVLALAIERTAKLVVIDERKGRRYAQRLGLPLTGTLGLLLLAKEKGLITAVSPLIAQLQTNGLYFAPELLTKTFHLAQENP